MSVQSVKKFFNVALLLLSVTFFVGCGSDDAKSTVKKDVKELQDSDLIKNTAKDVVNAMKDGDLDKVTTFISEKEAKEFKAQLKEMKEEDKNELAEMMKEMAAEVVSYGDVKVDGDKATLDMIVKKDGKEEKDPANFVKEGGKWKMIMD